MFETAEWPKKIVCCLTKMGHPVEKYCSIPKAYKKSQGLHLSTCIQLRVLKHPSRKVINFRHLLSCGTIVPVHQDHHSG